MYSHQFYIHQKLVLIPCKAICLLAKNRKKAIFYFLVGATTAASVLSSSQDVGELVPSVKIISDGVSLRNGRIAFETLSDFKKMI